MVVLALSPRASGGFALEEVQTLALWLDEGRVKGLITEAAERALEELGAIKKVEELREAVMSAVRSAVRKATKKRPEVVVLIAGEEEA